MTQQKPNYYAILPASIRYNKSIPPLGRLLYAEISALSNQQGYSWANNRYFAELYGISNVYVSRLINKLAEMGEIHILIDQADSSNRYIFIEQNQAYYDTKQSLENQQKNEYVPHSDNDSTHKQKFKTPHKQKFTTPLKQKFKHNNTSINTTSFNKKTNKKETPVKANQLADLLHDSVKERYSFTKSRPNERQRSAEEIDKLNRLDGYSWDIIESVLKWSQEDQFWKQNIRSGNKLRLKFEQLLIKIKSEHDRYNDRVTII